MNAAALLRRLLLALGSLAGVVVAVFILLRAVPGDPVTMMIPGEATPEDIQHLRAYYGLDKPLLAQFWVYLAGLLRGEFGISITMKQDVASLVLGRLPATFELAALALALSLAAGTALALLAAYWRGSFVEHAIDGVSAVLLAVPEFLWALLLVLAFAILLPWLPISGRMDPSLRVEFATSFYFVESLVRGNFGTAFEALRHLLLPALALSLPFIAVIARVLKTSLTDAMAQDYVLLARVKGFSRRRVLLRHALPNAILPMFSVVGVQITMLVSGTVLIELIFAYPGVGNLLYTAAVNRDLPLLQGVTIVFAALFTLLNLGVDMLYAALNPKISFH
jgi:ABC-type dipeptide/oligopeptide/nickel transport system permease component